MSEIKNTEKAIRARMQQKTKTASEWLLDVKTVDGDLREDAFVPMLGELIIYKPDQGQTPAYFRMKIGDGDHNVEELPFFAGTGSSGGTDSTVFDGVISTNTGIGPRYLNFFDGNAQASYAIASGSNDKTVLNGVIGNLANALRIDRPAAKGIGSFASGAGSVTNSSGAAAIGALVTAGVKGFYYSNINFEKKAITLSTKRENSTEGTGSNLAQYYRVGDVISLVNQNKYPLCCQITQIGLIDDQGRNLTNVIIVDNLPFSNEEDIVEYTEWGSYKPDDFTLFACYQDTQTKQWKVRQADDKEMVELGWAATALGVDGLSAGAASFSGGYANLSAGDFSITFGRENKSGYASAVFGWGNEGVSQCSLVGGYSNIVKGNYSLVVGQQNNSISGQTFIGGYNNKINSTCSNSIIYGENNVLGENQGAPYSAIFGKDNKIDGSLSFVTGKSHIITGNENATFGYHQQVGGTRTATFGEENINNGSYSIVLGQWNTLKTKCINSIVFGLSNKITANNGSSSTKNSLVGGTENTVNSSNVIIMGSKNTSNSNNVAIFGYDNQAGSSSTFIAGDGNITNTWTQAVIGRYCDYTTTGDALFVVGNGTKSGSGGITRSNAFLVFGDNTTVAQKITTESPKSLLSNKFNSAAGQKFNHVLAIGQENEVYGNHSATIGRKLKTESAQTLSVGYQNTIGTSSSCSFVSGQGLVANSAYMTVLGRNNNTQDKALLVIGNGTFASGTQAATRSDALVVHSTGRVTVGKHPEGEMDVVTLGFLNERLLNIRW